MAPETWEKAGRTLDCRDGLLIVKQTLKVQNELGEFLSKFRQQSGKPVTIHFTLISDADLMRLKPGTGLELDGDRPGHTFTLVDKDTAGELVRAAGQQRRLTAAPRLTVFPAQRGTCKLSRDVFYFKPTGQPQLFQLAKANRQEGVECKIRPVVSQDSKYFTLEIVWSHTALVRRESLSTAGAWEVGEPKFDETNIASTIVVPEHCTLCIAYRDPLGRKHIVLIRPESFSQEVLPPEKRMLVDEGPSEATGVKIFTWTGAGDDDWHTPKNWSPEGVPGPKDRAIIRSLGDGARYPTIRKPVEVGALDIQQNGPKVIIEAPINVLGIDVGGADRKQIAGVIVSMSDKVVQIDLGTRSGVQLGQVFEVRRNGQRIGTVTVKKADMDSAYCEPESGISLKGLQVGDSVGLIGAASPPAPRK